MDLQGVDSMNDNIKSKIRPYYYELQGYLSQTPLPQEQFEICTDDDAWINYNQIVQTLSEITSDDYSRFIIKPKQLEGENVVNLITFRQRLGGIINWLHANYFTDENRPFSGSPQNVITLRQNQSQSIQMVLDLTNKIDEEIERSKDDPKKKSFLQKMKSGLSHVKDANDLLNLLLKLYSFIN